MSGSKMKPTTRQLLDLVIHDLVMYGRMRRYQDYAELVYGMVTDPRRIRRQIDRVAFNLRHYRQQILDEIAMRDAALVDKAREVLLRHRKPPLLPRNTPAPVEAPPGVEEPPPLVLPDATVEAVEAAKDVEDDGVPVLEWLAHLSERRELEMREFPQHDVLDVWIKTDTPVGIIFSADWHLGSVGVDYERYVADLEFLLAHPDDLKIITVGDLIDNFVRFRSAEAVLQQIASPKLQVQLLRKIADALVASGQFLAAGWGNHDVTRDEQIIGHSPVAQLLAKRVAYFDGKGLIILRVGPSREKAVKYTIQLVHKPPGKSMYDPNWGGKKLYRTKFPADISVTAHLHKPAWQVDSHYEEARGLGFHFGGRRISIACGTYKTDDPYARRYYTEGRIGAPTVLLWPDHHRMEVFGSAEAAMVFKAGLLVADQQTGTPNQRPVRQAKTTTKKGGRRRRRH